MMETLQNGLRLHLDASAFRLGTDAVLLGDFAKPPRGAAVCDLCAGSGAVGLLLLDRDPSLTVTALELREEGKLEYTLPEDALDFVKQIKLLNP